MTTPVRPAVRILATAASLGAVFVAAACAGGDGPATGGSPSAAGDFSAQGPTELWQAKDPSGTTAKLVAAFNAQHPSGQVTLHELPSLADQQRQQMIQNSQVKNPAMGIVSVDVVWTAEFAANGFIVPLPADQFPTEAFLKPAVDASTYFNKLYAYPATSGGGMLYYRKDLLDKYDLQPPTTFAEMKSVCETVQAGEKNAKLECYAGQFNKYEGLTVNVAEAINGAGGVIVGDDGKPDVNSPEAAKGIETLVNGFKNGMIPKGAITWAEEEGRQAFQSGNLIFNRNWGYLYNLAQKTDGSSKVAGKIAAAPLPGITGPGVSSLGGHNYAIATHAANKGTAADFLKWYSEPAQQKTETLSVGEAPTLTALYSDPDVIEKLPWIPTQLKSIEGAKVRPKAVKYGDVSLAIQDVAYGALQGKTAPETAVSSLQDRLQSLIQ